MFHAAPGCSLLRIPLLIVAVGAALVAEAAAQIARPPAFGERGMAVSSSPAATEAGLAVLRDGGNAFDAAVAIGFALAATLPEAGNLGGGGFLLGRTAEGKEFAVDFRETAPRAAVPALYVDEAGRAVPERSRTGPLAVAVPGSPAGLLHVLSRYGSLPRAVVMAPAIRLARDGFVPPPILHALFREQETRERLAGCPDARRIFLDGAARLAPGAVFRQPELARTLELLAAEGAEVFYRGELGRRIVADLRRKGGVMTTDDLAAYVVKEREPLVGTYRGRRVVTMPPPSSGGTALLGMLNVLEGYPLERTGFGSERTAHLLAETMKRAFRDRAELLGDADFVAVPVRGLVAKGYGAAMRATIGETALAPDLVRNPDPLAYEKEETTHFAVMDAAGNAVACTTTLNGAFGAGVVAGDAGFLWNDEMDDFAVTPGAPNMFGLLQSERNRIEPGKRPLSSMTPTLLTEDGRAVGAFGSPGGPTIITTVLQTIVNVVDHRMTAAEATAAPRLHHQWRPDVLWVEPFGLAPEGVEALRRRGHAVKFRGEPGRPSYQGDAHVILRTAAGFFGAADPRRDGVAAGR
jgi:gamma-glutamyltranspeptidase/glutathione hydrolase